ncbi:MAG: hypothetical protein MI725_10495 [Pirellulales bacterium]|nr:hypothetical protein [Pirellulales bacterium]
MINIRDSIDHTPGRVDEVLGFLKQSRGVLRELRMVRIWTDRLEVIDINLDAYEIRGLGFADEEIIPVLDAVNAVYNQATIHEPTDLEYKEFQTGRRRPWAVDRVM